MTDTYTYESDEQFVERMRKSRSLHPIGRELHPIDRERIFDLALRGAAVRWRPISEVPPYRHVIVWVPASAGRNGHIRHNTIWCVDENKWVDENYDALEVQPTHFIPISALGEPNND
jgi:hypothetical protein